jgi:hypothetical protein
VPSLGDPQPDDKTEVLDRVTDDDDGRPRRGAPPTD